MTGAMGQEAPSPGLLIPEIPPGYILRNANSHEEGRRLGLNLISADHAAVETASRMLASSWLEPPGLERCD